MSGPYENAGDARAASWYEMEQVGRELAKELYGVEHGERANRIDANRRQLLAALDGIELGDFERRAVDWLAHQNVELTAAVARWIAWGRSVVTQLNDIPGVEASASITVDGAPGGIRLGGVDTWGMVSGPGPSMAAMSFTFDPLDRGGAAGELAVGLGIPVADTNGGGGLVDEPADENPMMESCPLGRRFSECCLEGGECLNRECQ